MRTLLWLLAPAALIAQVNVPYERIRDAAKEPGNWLTYSRDYTGNRYSPLDQIHRGNVGKLRIAWMRQVNELDTFETSPIVVDGTLYISEPPNGVVALDARTGRELWHYEWADKGGHLVGNRGVGMYGDWLYFLAPDGWFISLEARSGKERWRKKVARLHGTQLQRMSTRKLLKTRWTVRSAHC